MQSKAATVEEYLAELPEDRRAAMSKVRDVIRKNLPRGYSESMGYGMMGWAIPLSKFPNTYNGQPLPIVGLASQKQSMSLYLMGLYGDPALAKWFESEWKKTGKKLDMGKSCLRFKKLEDLNLDLIAQAVAKVPPDKLIALYEDARKGHQRKKLPARKKLSSASGRGAGGEGRKVPAKKKTATVKRPAAKR